MEFSLALPMEFIIALRRAFLFFKEKRIFEIIYRIYKMDIKLKIFEK